MFYLHNETWVQHTLKVMSDIEIEVLQMLATLVISLLLCVAFYYFCIKPYLDAKKIVRHRILNKENQRSMYANYLDVDI